MNMESLLVEETGYETGELQTWGDNKAATIYVGRATTVNSLFFYVNISSWIF